MEKVLIVLITSLIITGCEHPTGPGRGETFRFSEESLEKPEYNRDFIACDRIAKGNQHSVTGNAAGGAAAGASIAALTGLILGADIGSVTALGAMYGGVSGAAGTYAHNRHDFRSTFILCMRDRGYHVY